MRRGKRYLVVLDNQQSFEVPFARWCAWIAAGLFVLIAERMAKPARPGVVWLENGELHYPPDAVYPWINLNCRQIEQHALLDTRGPNLEPWQLQREIQESYGRSD